MDNSFLSSVSSRLYNFGSNAEAISANPMLMESKINLYGNSFCMDSRLCDDHDQFNKSYAIPSHQSSMYYQPAVPPSAVPIKRQVEYPYNRGTDSLTNTSRYDYTPQHPLSLIKNLSIPPFEVDFKAMRKDKKRPTTEVSRKCCATEWSRKKKMSLDYGEQWNHQAKEEAKEISTKRSVPARRSQKLSDRVTALQKLVSPYGKTDTASVLQEASIAIKMLQDKIQKFFDELNSSYINNKSPHLQKTEEKEADLRGKGLCLVPVSLTQRFTKEDQFNHY